MQDGSTNIKILGLNTNGSTPASNRMSGNVLNPSKPIVISNNQQGLQDDKMLSVANQMEDSVKQGQVEELLKQKLQKSITPSVFGIDPVGAINGLIEGIKGSIKTFGEVGTAVKEKDVMGAIGGTIYGTGEALLGLASVTPQLGAFQTAIGKVTDSGIVPEETMQWATAPLTTLMNRVEQDPALLAQVIGATNNNPALQEILKSPLGRKSLAGITDIGLQGAVFHGITKGFKSIKGSKTSTDVQGDLKTESPTQTKALTEVAGRNPIRQELKKQQKSAESESVGERPFVGSVVGDTKLKLTPEEQMIFSKQKLEVQTLVNEISTLQTKAEVLANQLKAKRTKANKEAYKKVVDELEVKQQERLNLESELEAWGTYARQREIQGLLPERGSSTSGGFDFSGKNKPSDIDFTGAQDPLGRIGGTETITTKSGRQTTKPTEGIPSERLQPVKTSMHDYLVNRALDLFKMVKADKPIDPIVLSDILRKARDNGKYEEALDILRQEAFRRGKTLEFETALKNSVAKTIVEDVKPAELSDGIKISEIKDTTPVTSTVEQIKKAQEIIGEDTFKQIATEITKDKDPFLQGVFTEELANKIVQEGKLPDEYKGALPKVNVTGELPVQGKINIGYKFDNGDLIAYKGTHGDATFNALLEKKGISYPEFERMWSEGKVEGGYIDSRGRFYTDAKKALDAEKIDDSAILKTTGADRDMLDRIANDIDLPLSSERNRIISEELNKKADDILRKNLGNVSSNPIFNHKVYQALLIKGAYHFENGITNLAKWSKKMIEENGEKIRPMLNSIWKEIQNNAKLVNVGELTNLKDKLNKQTNPTEISSTVKDYFKVDTANMNEKQKKSYDDLSARLGNDLKTFFNDKNVSPEVQSAVLETINKMSESFGGKKYSSSELTYVRSQAFDKASQMTKAYGSYGGEWFNKSFKGSIEFGRIMKDGHDMLNVIRGIQQKAGKLFDKSYGKVVDALQDRANATEILKGDEVAQDVYPLMEQFLDYMKAKMEAKGYKVEEDYYFRMTKHKMFSDFFNQSPKLEDINTQGIENFYTVNSKFLKERVKEEASNIRTDFNAVYGYLNSTARELAYKELRDYTSNEFITGVKSNKLLSKDFKYVREALENLTNPEKILSGNWRLVEKVKGGMYTAFLWNNPKLSIVNYYQKLLAKGFITPEAEKLAMQIYNEKYQPTGRLFDAITETKADAPAYLGESTYSWDKGKFRQMAEKYDLFRLSESSNWNYSEGAGVINSVMRQTGAKTFAEIEKALTDQKVFDKAVNEARDLSARTQVSPDAAFRPLLYDKAYARLVLMFTRYPLAMTDLLINSVFKKLEGIDGLRAQNILRRGLSEETAPVEMLRSTEYMRKNLELALKEAKKDRYEPPASTKVLKEYIEFFKAKETELNNVIKTLEPLDRTRISKQWVKYIGISAVVSFAYRLFQAELWDAVGLNKDQRKKNIGKHIVDTMIDTSPVPVFRVASGKFFQPPIMPSVEFFIYGNYNPKGVTRELTDYATKVIPGVNVTGQMLQRGTGLTFGKVLTKTIFGSGSGNGRTH